MSSSEPRDSGGVAGRTRGRHHQHGSGDEAAGRPRSHHSNRGTAAFLPPTKEEVHAFACFRLSVCLLARLLKNACMDLDEMLRVDRCRDMDELINF